MDKNLPQVRRIEKVWKSQKAVEGAGVHLRRAFGFHELGQLDPFLLLDAFGSENPDDYKRGFPWHPHRGIETITYLLDGSVEHGDSMGNRGLIAAGDVQWMTAGSGIIHQEMPKGDSKGQMWGFQLWSNLPANDKMIDPRYQEVKQADIPVVTLPDGAVVRIVAGEIGGVKGPVKEIITEPEFFDISLPSSKQFIHTFQPEHSVFAYVFEGEAYFDTGRDAFSHEAMGENLYDIERPCICGPNTLVKYGPGNQVVISTENKAVRFLLISGKPIKEQVAWYGPIVMNTEEELREAFEEFNNGTFVKYNKKAA